MGSAAECTSGSVPLSISFSATSPSMINGLDDYASSGIQPLSLESPHVFRPELTRLRPVLLS